MPFAATCQVFWANQNTAVPKNHGVVCFIKVYLWLSSRKTLIVSYDGKASLCS
jgi:hypothetical protein